MPGNHAPKALNTGTNPDTPILRTLLLFPYVYSEDSTEKLLWYRCPGKQRGRKERLGTKQLLNCTRGGETENKAEISSACLSSGLWKLLSKRPKFNFVQLGREKCFQKLKAEPGRACQNSVPTAAAQWKVCGKAVLLQRCASLPRTGMFWADHEATPPTPHTALKTFPSDTPQDSSKARERTVKQKPPVHVHKE